ncbi:MAG: TetR/AcrR family transcriptional regulator [Alphaproteobacteria bacterium]
MTRGPDKQFDRDEALGKAMEVFWAQGYEATGVTELLEHMGIGRQSMYDTFGSKRSLFLEVLHRYCDELGRRLIAQLRAPGSPLGNIRKVFGIWEDLLTDRGEVGCLVGNTVGELGPHDREAAATLRSSLEGVEQALAETLSRAQAEGELGADLDAHELASLMVVTVQGTALLRKVYGGPGLARSVLRGFMSMLERK